MTDNLTFKGEAMLLSWSDSAAGKKVTFLLPEDGNEHPFKGFKSGPKYGQAFALGCQAIDYDNPEPPKAGDPVASVKGYAKPPMTESQRCGMLCADVRFQQWLFDKHREWWECTIDIDDESQRPPDIAADVIRHVLGIKSRKELDADGPPHVIGYWKDIVAQFEADTGRMAERTR